MLGYVRRGISELCVWGQVWLSNLGGGLPWPKTGIQGILGRKVMCVVSRAGRQV